MDFQIEGRELRVATRRIPLEQSEDRLPISETPPEFGSDDASALERQNYFGSYENTISEPGDLRAADHWPSSAKTKLLHGAPTAALPAGDAIPSADLAGRTEVPGTSLLSPKEFERLVFDEKREKLAQLGVEPEILSGLEDADLNEGYEALLADIVAGNGQAPQTERPRTLVDLDHSELRALPTHVKQQFLESLGVPSKEWSKKKGLKRLDDAFIRAVEAMKVPGNRKVELKLDKKYELKIDVDSDGTINNFDLKQKKGFFHKIAGVLKKVSPIAAFVLAPVTGGLSLVAMAGSNAAVAIKNKNWLGAIASAAGAVAGIGSLAGSVAGKTAGLVAKGARSVQGGMLAIRTKSPGGLLAAIAGGAGALSGLVGNKAQSFETWAARFGKAASVVQGAQAVVHSAKTRDFLGAATAALGTGAVAAKQTSPLAQRLKTYSLFAATANGVEKALTGMNYAQAISLSVGLADSLKAEFGNSPIGNAKFQAISELSSRSATLEAALKGKDPMAVIAAARELNDTVKWVRGDALQPAFDLNERVMQQMKWTRPNAMAATDDFVDYVDLANKLQAEVNEGTISKESAQRQIEVHVERRPLLKQILGKVVGPVVISPAPGP